MEWSIGYQHRSKQIKLSTRRKQRGVIEKISERYYENRLPRSTNRLRLRIIYEYKGLAKAASIGQGHFPLRSLSIIEAFWKMDSNNCLTWCRRLLEGRCLSFGFDSTQTRKHMQMRDSDRLNGIPCMQGVPWEVPWEERYWLRPRETSNGYYTTFLGMISSEMPRVLL